MRSAKSVKRDHSGTNREKEHSVKVEGSQGFLRRFSTVFLFWRVVRRGAAKPRENLPLNGWTTRGPRSDTFQCQFSAPRKVASRAEEENTNPVNPNGDPYE
jgi:hypothetical protein